MFSVNKLQITLLAMFIVYSLCRKGNEDRHFRSNKLNLIWQKLQDKMSSNKLQDLQRALSEQDNKEMNWKELKLHGGDADGMIEAGLRRSLFRILDKYGHKKIVGDLSESDAKSEAGVDDNTVRSDGDFVDKRLRHLWQLAKKHGKFKDEEMDDLRTEFEHHRLKIDEYNVLLNTLQKQHEISDNSLDVHDKLKDHEMDKLKSELKDIYVEMKLHFTQLREKVTDEVVNTPFKDYRVIELWEKAKGNNFTEEELQSIKEELKHFEHKINKHEHFRRQMKKSERMVHAGKNVDHETYQYDTKKTKEHLRYVKKMHHTLLERISKKDEL